MDNIKSLIKSHKAELKSIDHLLARQLEAGDFVGIEEDQQWEAERTVLSKDDSSLVFSAGTVELVSPTNLDELFEACKARALPIHDDLPTFGGDEPDDTCGVWSWDKDRLLVGTCADDLEIVERGEL